MWQENAAHKRIVCFSGQNLQILLNRQNAAVSWTRKFLNLCLFKYFDACQNGGEMAVLGRVYFQTNKPALVKIDIGEWEYL